MSHDRAHRAYADPAAADDEAEAIPFGETCRRYRRR
jgi:hypothetical protein